MLLLLGKLVGVTVAGSAVLGLALLTAELTFATVLQDLLPSRLRAFGVSLVYFFGGFLGLGLAPTLVALATDRLYHSEQALGPALVTVIIPAVVAGIALFLFAARTADRRAEARRQAVRTAAGPLTAPAD